MSRRNYQEHLAHMRGTISQFSNGHQIAQIASYMNEMIDTINTLMDRVEELEDAVDTLTGE